MLAQLRRRALNDPSFPSFSRAVYFDLSACGKVFEAKLLSLRANFVFFLLWPGKIVVTGSEIAPTGQWTLYSCSKRSKGSPNRREEVERQRLLFFCNHKRSDWVKKTWSEDADSFFFVSSKCLHLSFCWVFNGYDSHSAIWVFEGLIACRKCNFLRISC